MGTTSVVPQEPRHQLLIESLQVVSQELPIAIDEGFHHGPIKAFNLGIHLGTTRVSVEVNQAGSRHLGFKMIGELRTVEFLIKDYP